jgi:hypothetical protein
VGLLAGDAAALGCLGIDLRQCKCRSRRIGFHDDGAPAQRDVGTSLRDPE